MGRAHSIDTHPKKAQIIREIVSGRTSYSKIAVKYDIPNASITRYVRDRLMEPVAERIQRDKWANADALLNQLRENGQKIQIMFDSCHEWLQDPEHPDKYNLDPRDTELQVVYKEVIGETNAGNPIYERKKAPLSELLQKTDKEIVTVSHRIADPRKLLLDAANVMSGHLKQISDILSLIPERDNKNQVNILQIVMAATEDVPEIRQRIAEAMAEQGEIS